MSRSHFENRDSKSEGQAHAMPATPSPWRDDFRDSMTAGTSKRNHDPLTMKADQNGSTDVINTSTRAAETKTPAKTSLIGRLTTFKVTKHQKNNLSPAASLQKTRSASQKQRQSTRKHHERKSIAQSYQKSLQNSTYPLKATRPIGPVCVASFLHRLL